MAGRPSKAGKRTQLEIGLFDCPKCKKVENGHWSRLSPNIARARVIKWPDIISGTVYDPIQFKAQIPMLKLNLFLAYAFMEEAGTGGGLFRRIYSRFLREASDLMVKSADIWTEIANILLVASEAQRDKVKDILARAQPKIMECAEIEKKAFKLLASVA